MAVWVSMCHSTAVISVIRTQSPRLTEGPPRGECVKTDPMTVIVTLSEFTKDLKKYVERNI